MLDLVDLLKHNPTVWPFIESHCSSGFMVVDRAKSSFEYVSPHLENHLDLKIERLQKDLQTQLEAHSLDMFGKVDQRISQQIEFPCEDEIQFFKVSLLSIAPKSYNIIGFEKIACTWWKEPKQNGALPYQIKTDLEAKYLYLNQAYLEAFPKGSRTERIGENSLQDIHESSVEDCINTVEKALKNPGILQEVCLIKSGAKGEKFYTEWYFIAPRDSASGSPTAIYAKGRDISKRKIVEEEVRGHRESISQMQHELGLFFDNTILGAFFMMMPEPLVWDENTDREKALDWVFENQKITRVNRAMLEQYGAENENAFLGYRPKDFFAHDIEEGRNIWRAFFDKGRWFLRTYERKLDGSPVVFEGDYTLLKDEQGRITGHFGVQRDITEQVKNQEELQAKKNQLLKITENIPGVVFQVNFIKEQDHLEFLSPNYESLKLKPKREELYQNFANLGKYIHPNDYSTFVGSLLYSSKRLEPLELEFRMLNDQEEYLWIRLKAQAERLDKDQYAWYGVFNDVTERVMARAEQKKLALVSEQIADAVLIFDPQNRLSWHNKAFSDLLGLSNKVIEGQSLGDLIKIHPLEDNDHQQEQFKEFKSCLTNQSPAEIQLCLQRENQEGCWVKMRNQPIWNKNGEFEYSLLVINDIHLEITQKEEQQTLLNLTSEQNKRLQNFTYIVSHNIRSHSANLAGLIEAMERAESKNEYEELWRYLVQVSDNLESTIKHLNQIISINTNLNKSKRTLNLKEEYEKVYSVIQSEVNAVGARFKCSIDPSFKVNAIPAYLESIILNLLTNTIRYRSPERFLEVEISAEKRDRQMVLHIKDNGLGIDLEKHGSKIFKLYQTFHANNEARGLGLYILKSQIEAMGGEVQVKSKVGIGSTFSVFFENEYL